MTKWIASKKEAEEAIEGIAFMDETTNSCNNYSA